MKTRIVIENGIPIESRFKTLLADWKRKNQKIGELKAYIDELEYKLKNV